jgi:hypothetical protein
MDLVAGGTNYVEMFVNVGGGGGGGCGRSMQCDVEFGYKLRIFSKNDENFLKT